MNHSPCEWFSVYKKALAGFAGKGFRLSKNSPQKQGLPVKRGKSVKRGAKSPSFRVELAGHEAQRSGENPGRFFEATFPTAGRDPKGADKPRRSGGLSVCRKDFFDRLRAGP